LYCMMCRAVGAVLYYYYYYYYHTKKLPVCLYVMLVDL